MEDLLASIRKAINEDIGPETSAIPAGQAMTGEPAATSSEIEQLREKITRSRTAAAPRDPAQRAASLAAALRSNTPRRSWRDIEPVLQAQSPPPAQPAPRIRGTVTEPEPTRAPVRTERPMTRPTPRVPREPQPSAWPREDAGTSLLREGDRLPKTADAPILSGGSAQAVQSSFSRLADSLLARAIGEQSIEDMTRELLKVMLKQWLDENLPPMVERLVREEIERVARTGR
jgi:cell pole-organizing protein PopZ